MDIYFTQDYSQNRLQIINSAQYTVIHWGDTQEWKIIWTFFKRVSKKIITVHEMTCELNDNSMKYVLLICNFCLNTLSLFSLMATPDVYQVQKHTQHAKRSILDKLIYR
jgi:hypothetical protein